MRTTPDAQPESMPTKRTERQVFRRVLRKRNTSSLPGGTSMGANYDWNVLKRSMRSETADMLAVKQGYTGAKIGRSAVDEKK